MAVSGRCVRVHSNGVLIVPMQDANGVLWNRQAINAKGHKRFNDGGKVEKLALWVPEPPAAGQPWYSTEGFADALAIHSATGQPVLVAFSAGNMLAAIQERQHQVDLSQLTVAADNDPAGRQAVEKVRTLYPVKAVFPRTGKDGLVRHLGQPGHGRAEGRAGGYSGR